MTERVPQWPRILVILPVHNRRATTALFIDCLLAQIYTNWHLLLIDDGSTDGTAEFVREKVSSLTVLRGHGNWWWGGALHQGYRWLKRQDGHHGDLVLIINDDTEFAPDFLGNAIQLIEPRSLLLAQLYNGAGDFVEAGVRFVQCQAGHESASTTALYTCVSSDFRTRTLRRALDQTMAAALPGTGSTR